MFWTTEAVSGPFALSLHIVPTSFQHSLRRVVSVGVAGPEDVEGGSGTGPNRVPTPAGAVRSGLIRLEEPDIPV